MKFGSVIAQTPKGFDVLYVGSPAEAAAKYRKIFKAGAPAGALKVALVSHYGILKQFKARSEAADQKPARKSKKGE